MTSFDIRNRVEPHGARRLTLLGELDVASAPVLEDRLKELRKLRCSVTLDLSELSFMDSAGIRAVLLAVIDARRDGWNVEVDRQLSPTVERVVAVSGVEKLMWPDNS